MKKNEKMALRVLGQREMLYKMQSLIAQRFMHYSYPIKQCEINRFVSDLCADLNRLEGKFCVQQNLNADDLREYHSYDALFNAFADKQARAESAMQVRFDFGALEDIDKP